MAGNRDMEQQRRLSLRLYGILENVGASEKMRKLHQRTAITEEILGTVYFCLLRETVHPVYLCGSTYEGSITPDLSSDVDHISCFTDLPVVLDPSDSSTHGSLLMVSDEWTYPGYVKLQAMMDGCPLTRYNKLFHKEMFSNDWGRLFRRHFKGDNMVGPADKEWDEDGTHILDFVGAYKCKKIPVFASQRFGLLQKRKLISEDECERLNSMGCMFVGAGFFLSSENEIEWRLSFTLQERYLMSKLNPTQHKVYILLKMIKRNIEKVTSSKVLTSYHCKTCVLFAVEMTPPRSWTPDNLIKCLLQCIKLLILWLKNGYCPNFLNKDQNLFLKKGFSTSRKPMLQTLELLLQTNNDFLTLLETDHIGDILKTGELRWKNEIDMKKREHVVNLKSRLIKTILIDFSFILHRLCGGQYDPFNLISIVEFLQEADDITAHDVHTTVETQAALGYIYPWFHLHIAKSLACLSQRCHTRSYSKQMMQLCDVHFRKARMTDLVNTRLARASVLYKLQQYRTCFRLLQQIENMYTHKVMRYCPCLNLDDRLYKDEQESVEEDKSISSMPVRKVMKQLYASCVLFLPSEVDIVPSPLQYEMFRSMGTEPGSRDETEDFWFDWCAIDAKVYLYLMQYLVSIKLEKEAHKQAAMDNIQETIKEDTETELEHEFRQLGHRETACNILGWIYMQEQRYGDALECFLNSWEYRPFHNAAKFHMRDFLTNPEMPDMVFCIE